MGYHIANRRIQNTRFAELVPSPGYDWIPTGTVFPLVDDTAPEGWLVCNGGTHNDSDYPKLAQVMHKFEAKWGAGDWSNKFLVPDLRGRTLIGNGVSGYADDVWKTGGSKDAVVVEHSHKVKGDTNEDGAHEHGGPGDTFQGAFVVNTNQYLGLHNGHGGGGVNPWQSQSNAGSPLGVNGNYSTHPHHIDFESQKAGVGNSGVNQNLQPYFALLYIIKT